MPGNVLFNGARAVVVSRGTMTFVPQHDTVAASAQA
jgi:hypothetical protein